MDISIFGMGYVGAVCAACLAERGHNVIGVEISPVKVDLINQGKSPIVEPGLDELIQRGVAQGRIRATSDTLDAIRHSELSMICVGTPSKKSGDLDLKYIETVAREIGQRDAPQARAAHGRRAQHGAARHRHRRDRAAAHGDVGQENPASTSAIAVNPEFLRESTAIKDYNNPPMTVIGEWDQASGDLLASLYEACPAR